MRVIAIVTLLAFSLCVNAEAPQIEPWVHSTEFSRSESDRPEYILGLGALQKIGGRWRFKNSESLSGQLLQVTWQVNEGFTSAEGFEKLRAQIPADAKLLFECSGRSCGSSAQWANRVFGERVLYGHDERQRYAVWRIESAGQVWSLVLYGVDRANRRHFLHMDLLEHGIVP